MASVNNPKKPAVWQDIKPASSLAKPTIPKKKIGKIALFLISFKKPWLRLIFVIKNLHIIVAKFKKLQIKNKIAIVLSVTAILGTAGYFIINNNHINSKTNSNGVKIEDLAAKKPQYQTYLPSGKKISDLGGWQRVSPVDRVAVFAFIDTIDNVQISVSQQQLPEDFKEDTIAQIEQLAKSFKADQKITIGSTKVYIGTSIKGPQSVIFYKNQTLILIKSASKISNESWSKYISSLN